MIYGPVHAIKGAHACYAVLGFVCTLNSAVTTHKDAKAVIMAGSPNAVAQNESASGPLSLVARLLDLAVRYVYLICLLIVVSVLKLFRLATGRH